MVETGRLIQKGESLVNVTTKAGMRSAISADSFEMSRVFDPNQRIEALYFRVARGDIYKIVEKDAFPYHILRVNPNGLGYFEGAKCPDQFKEASAGIRISVGSSAQLPFVRRPRVDYVYAETGRITEIVYLKAQQLPQDPQLRTYSHIIDDYQRSISGKRISLRV